MNVCVQEREGGRGDFFAVEKCTYPLLNTTHSFLPESLQFLGGAIDDEHTPHLDRNGTQAQRKSNRKYPWP